MADSSSSQAPQQPRHAFNHAPAALRIFRFAADSAPRVLQIAHISAFLRECAVEFGSVDATLPGALRNEHAAGRYFKMCTVVDRKAKRCPWLAAKLLACRSGAPVPAAALAPDVTRHDVNWGAEGARRHADLQLAHGGFGLVHDGEVGSFWAQGPVGVTRGKHFFEVCVAAPSDANSFVGFVDDKIATDRHDHVAYVNTKSTGAAYHASGLYHFGSPPLLATSGTLNPNSHRPCVVGCLLNLDATPARMAVFLDGEPLAVQCDYDFPKDGRAWYPSVSLFASGTALRSCAI
jgi:hypothetical protein